MYIYTYVYICIHIYLYVYICVCIIALCQFTCSLACSLACSLTTALALSFASSFSRSLPRLLSCLLDRLLSFSPSCSFADSRSCYCWHSLSLSALLAFSPRRRSFSRLLSRSLLAHYRVLSLYHSRSHMFVFLISFHRSLSLFGAFSSVSNYQNSSLLRLARFCVFCLM